MARLLIYDAYENKVYTYANLNENDPMPYSTLTTLRLREFRGKSASPTLWTTIAAMEACSSFSVRVAVSPLPRLTVRFVTSFSPVLRMVK